MGTWRDVWGGTWGWGGGGCGGRGEWRGERYVELGAVVTSEGVLGCWNVVGKHYCLCGSWRNVTESVCVPEKVESVEGREK